MELTMLINGTMSQSEIMLKQFFCYSVYKHKLCRYYVQGIHMHAQHYWPGVQLPHSSGCNHHPASFLESLREDFSLCKPLPYWASQGRFFFSLSLYKFHFSQKQNKLKPLTATLLETMKCKSKTTSVQRRRVKKEVTFLLGSL